jgi:hypothetical protein
VTTVGRAVHGIRNRAETYSSLATMGGAIALAAYSYASIPAKLVSVHSNTFTALRWVSPVLWTALFVSILIVIPPKGIEPFVSPLEARPWIRRSGTVLIWFFGLAQLWVISLLVHFLLHNKVTNNGTDLIHIAARVEGTTVVIASFAFWFLDKGGPIARQEGLAHEADFLWPQTENPAIAPQNWAPSYLDYLYVAFTNGVAFSPTDVMPLSARMKMIMMVEAGASAITLILVAARAVNILNA